MDNVTVSATATAALTTVATGTTFCWSYFKSWRETKSLFISQSI